MSEKVKVDIWSDVACPWCYVGKRRFETALAGFAGRDDAPEVEIEYHSFELAPDTPVDFEGTEVDFLAKHKGMPAGQVEQMLGQMTTVAAAEGLAYDFDALQHTKTLKAHELLHLAKSRGKQVEMKERLLKAYFEQGRHVGRIDELVALATEVGLDADEVRTALESGQFEDDVEQDIAQARAYGISGVPFFVFNGKYGVSGAQDPAVFTQVLDQVVADAAESVA
ncbi:DsbA family oxidoreductase [Oerskovia turbata]|uniref:DsbA family oxidoreductase n=1 Tax=Oerskovia turbata TaxID=1713 RepID=A0A4Q1KUH0_9CELL|nr:DsbA family oxidoreductase [Oerskovia turbata]RXR25809.1 DsbA family oxidoreductase [Oerskovia turbata]RXR33375.1 DsbA family oxidoreductase [Oerskovia turbata]TGJ96169.1 DsbA family oxidoreductase [Actinotalea fermentans ATCC 43279 = JCM 9966 = DSM 3133]